MRKPKVALIAGAGFSALWGMPLASQIMDESDFPSELPGKWQSELLDIIRVVWNETQLKHKGVVDEFTRLIQQSNSLTLIIEKMIETRVVLDEKQSSGQVLARRKEPSRTKLELSYDQFISFLALRFSAKHWNVGTARETKWGTGDHIRKKRDIPGAYKELLYALKKTEITGIVTTNYDLVVEKLLGPLSSGRLGGFNYGKIGEELAGRHAINSQWGYGPVKITGKIPLLKLHGSLNWALSDQDEIVKYIDARPSRGRRYRSLLLPPVDSPTDDKLKPVWKKAKDVLQDSDLWLICGYSLPDYDQRVKELLRLSTKMLKKIVVLDVEPKPIIQRLNTLFGNNKPSDGICGGPGITSNIERGDISPLLGLS